MELKLYVYDLEGAIVARAALDGMIQAFLARGAKVSRQAAAEDSGIISGSTDTVEQQPDDTKATAEVTEVEDAEEHGNGTLTFTKEQVKAAAAHNAELAALVAKKGRKSAAEQTRIQELTWSVMAEKPGIELAGKKPTELAEMLAPTQTQVLERPVEQVVVTTTVIPTPNASFDPLAAIEAAEAAAAGQVQQVVEQPAAEVVQPVAGKNYDTMANDELFAELQTMAEEDGKGLFWFRKVVELGGGMSKLTADHMRDVLKNPDKYTL